MWIQHPRFRDYLFNTNGEVASLKYGRWRDLVPTLGNTGYYYIQINKGAKTLHRLLCECYYGTSTLQVNHIDGNKLNNAISNLEYCSNASNVWHAWMLGKHENTRAAARLRRGERSPHCKKSDAEIEEVRGWYGQMTQTAAAIKCGMSRSWVGFIWSNQLRR